MEKSSTLIAVDDGASSSFLLQKRLHTPKTLHTQYGETTILKRLGKTKKDNP